jgi:hypothetical protein
MEGDLASDPWPNGSPGDWIVAPYDQTGRQAHLIWVADRKEADAKFKEAMNFPDVWRVVLISEPNQGTLSPVVCMTRWDDGERWTVVSQTKGYQQVSRKWPEQ